MRRATTGTSPPSEPRAKRAGAGRQWIVLIFGIAFIAVWVRFIVASFEYKLWLDDLYTLNLLAASDLNILWRGIVLGIDGNPPGYLTLAWLATHLFAFASPVMMLRLASVAMIGFGVLALHCMARRFLPATIALLTTMVFLAVSRGARIGALELRTYALYFLVDALCLLLLLRWIECRSRGRWMLLAAALGALPMTHTFGTVYALCLGTGAGAVALARGDKRLAIASIGCMVPALLVAAAWSPFLLRQTEVGRPYGWISAPDYRELVFGPLLQAVLIVGLLWAARMRFAAALSWRVFLARIDLRIFVLLAVATLEICFAIFLWEISRIFYPVYVARYLMPAVIIDYGIIAVLLSIVSGALRRHMFFATAVAIWCLWVGAWKDPRADIAYAGPLPCLEGGDDHFIEAGIATRDLPIVTESPHVWFPRRRYGHGVYIFPLDWQVVERYPEKARNNATDFHIMQRFRDWAQTGGVLTTSELLDRYPEFLVLHEKNRSWLDNLIQSVPLSSTEIKSGADCSLWHVRILRRPGT
jgi:hypothetical protein